MNNDLDHIIELIRRDHSIGAPDEVIRQAKRLYRTRPQEAKASLFRRVVASLQAELAPNKAAFGERSAGSAQARQLLFEAGDNGIDLRVSTSGRSLSIRGQILGEGISDDANVELTGPTTKACAVDNGLGFEFTGVQPGEYTLVINTSDEQIVIEDLLLQ